MNNEPKRSWAAVDITVDASASEAIEFAFNELGALGTEIDGLRKDPSEPVCVTGFFDVVPDDELIQQAVDESLRIYQLSDNTVQIGSRTVEETDWLAEWKKHWKPQDVGRFTIAPPWADVPVSERILIRIEPNMAFGTGTHETTQLCLRSISENYDPAWSLLDVGTGTGVLAIAAAKLGGTNIFACDVDQDSVTIAIENAAKNDVADNIKFAEGSIDAATPHFDMVCANLTLDVIEPMLPLLVEKARKVLLLSGILGQQESAALAALKGLIVKDPIVTRAGEWIAIMVRV